MAILYKNTGKSRATTLVIERKVGGVNITGYPKTYSLTAAYPTLSLPLLTTAQMRLLSEEAYIARRDAIIAYAKSETQYAETPSAIAVGSINTDTTSCPIAGYVEP
jgi:hypothetical protein